MIQQASAIRRRVLVVDDSKAQRMLLRLSLERWNYDVAEAETGDSALELCKQQQFDIILSDWMMPGLTGPEFCSLFRSLTTESYSYFILLTSKSNKDEVALGLDAGADDFLSKPINSAELRARMQAGERLLGMQRELQLKNQQLGETLTVLQDIYDSLDRDLIEARKLQQSLVRGRHHDFGSAQVSLLLRPSGHVGGDLVGYFPLSAERLAIFSVDVSGHGVASAMMAARLAGMFSISGDVIAEGSAPRISPPETITERLNTHVLEVMQVDQYFTWVYADADLASGRVSLTQAGHPHPMLIRATGQIEHLGRGGMPIGLIPGAKWDRTEIILQPGDQLFLMTDGLTECRAPSGAELGEEGLTEIISQIRDLRGTDFLDRLEYALENFSQSKDFPDDVSAILLHWEGPRSDFS